MGLLDDAIREHLDLKRRRGADPAEIERAEREALGPVRRQPEPIEPTGFEDEPLAGDELGYEAGPFPEESGGLEEPPATRWADEEFADPAFDDPAGGGWASEALPAATDETRPQGDPFAEDVASHGAPEPAHDPLLDEPEAEPHLGQETVEYHLGDPATSAPGRGGLEEAPPAGEDDVLEETPEFLQDAPEHDRLWFEQRPPKDFDFDE
jgi:hypothetical protein